jgi:cytochrome P450
MRLNGEAHRRQRNMIMPAFRQVQVERYVDVIVNMTDRMLSTWTVDETRRLDHDLLRLVTHISIQTIFGMRAEQEGARLLSLIKRLIRSFSSPLMVILPFDLPGLPFRAIMNTTNEIERFVTAVIKDKAAALDAHRDVLSEIMKARDSSGVGFTATELVGHAYTILCQESVASALLWIVFLLDRHPSAYRRAIAEIDATLKDAAPGLDDLRNLPYLDLVAKEALRLFPPSPFGLRYAANDCQLGDYRVRKGTGVFFSSFVTHRMPDIFSDPLKFEPERWQSATPSQYEYLPFGTGAHSCIGQRLAMLELKTILVMVLQKFRVSLAPGAKVDLGVHISLVPKHGLPVVLGRPNLEPRGVLAKIAGNVHAHADLRRAG